MDTRKLDLRGLNCPMPVLRSRKEMRAMRPGERLLVEATDPLSVVDLPNWAREEGHAMVEYRSEAGIHFFLFERGPG